MRRIASLSEASYQEEAKVLALPRGYRGSFCRRIMPTQLRRAILNSTKAGGFTVNCRLGLVLTAIAVITSGCASKPQQPISLGQDAIGSKSGRVGVAMAQLPKLDTQVPGANCLLCLAVAALANSSLTTHAQTLPYDDITSMKETLARLLRDKGADAFVIDEYLDINGLPSFDGGGGNLAKKDFTSFGKKYSINRLLVIEVKALGFIRTYSAYIPTSDPKAYFKGDGYLVDLKRNAYEWYLPVVVTKSTDGNWDEPPTFPGLTNAYFQAIETGKDALLRPIRLESPTTLGSASQQMTVQ